MQLHYRQVGQGDPVVVLHGLFGMSDNWLTIAGRIAQNYSVYLVDQRNHGRSPHVDEFNYQVLVEDLKEFVDSQNLFNIKLIGHSLGGKVAMIFALNFPEYLHKLVVVDIAPRRYRNRIFKNLLEQLMSIDLARITNYIEAGELLKNKIKDPQVQQFLLKNLYRDENKEFRWRINLDSLYKNMDAILSGEPFRGAYAGDSLFIRGGLSDYIQADDEPLIRQRFPKARIETIPKATHWVHSDATVEFCDLLKTYL